MRKFEKATMQAVYDQYSSHNPPTGEIDLWAAYQRGLGGQWNNGPPLGTLAYAAYRAGLDKRTKMWGTDQVVNELVNKPNDRADTDRIVDEIYALVKDLSLAEALEALTACVMGTVEQCSDPNKALLAVIAELTSLVRFSRTEPEKGGRAPSLENWIVSTWS